MHNTARYHAIFEQITVELLDAMPMEHVPGLLINGLEQQRGHSSNGSLPLSLRRWHEVRLLPPTKVVAGSVRELKAASIGRLVKVCGIVTRASDVRPLAEVITYTCETCGHDSYHDVSNQKSFLPLSHCTSQPCVANKMMGRIFPQTRSSKFTKYQELRIQELPSHVPVGHVPRSIAVHCRGELTRRCIPGDTIVLSGVFLPQYHSCQFTALRRGLNTDTFLEAMAIDKVKKNYFELEVNSEVDDQIDELANSRDAYSRLARSIAPEIFGHEDVKKALLLQLVGGVTRTLVDGVRIRGDINICLMGDPGVAKSQLLKSIAATSPRGIYTTGKGSSGVGLTAAVVRDTSTSETSLEGGALVLADCGVGCIDEFDKMDEYDRTAIHEVMEQQTVSIAKAGITTTLNARTAVLAAANPVYGRYVRGKTMAENINLPNSLLSRFDLMFLLLDTPEIEGDVALARHVTHVHSHLSNPKLDFLVFGADFLAQYIAQARQFEPLVPRNLSSTIIETYVAWRQRSVEIEQGSMTPRQLLSILRLAQALARLRLDSQVCQDDVSEACRLSQTSKTALYLDCSIVSEDAKSAAFNLLCNCANEGNTRTLNYSQVKSAAIKQAIREDDFLAMLQEYEELGILYINADHTAIQLC